MVNGPRLAKADLESLADEVGLSDYPEMGGMPRIIGQRVNHQAVVAPRKTIASWWLSHPSEI